MAKKKSNRKRAKQKRQDYRVGGNVFNPNRIDSPMPAKKPVSRPDRPISIGRTPSPRPEPEPIAKVGRPVPPPIQQPKPSPKPTPQPRTQPRPRPTPQPQPSVPISTGPGFTTGTDPDIAKDYGDFGGLFNPGGESDAARRDRGGSRDDGGRDDDREAPPGGKYSIVRNGFIYVWNGYTYVNTGNRAGGDEGGGDEGGGDNGGSDEGGGDNGGGDEGGGNEPDPDPLETMTDAQRQAAFEEERRIRNIQEGRTSQEIASGNIPAGTVPVPTVMGIGREGTEADTVVAPDASQVGTSTIDQTPEETISQVDEVAQIDPAREVTTTTTPTATIEQAAQARAAQQDKEELRLAEAADVADVTPVEDVDVVIEPGAVAKVVTGTLSPGAKARIVENTGTNLARVTRAKKQLANAGLEEGAIQELGKDPETLEAKLTDFTEEERGIIEGLPEEALVSNQLESLLTGIEEGEIPTWARPAVASVEAMLAKRGLEASSIARDSLANTIIQASLPLAQANAQAIQASVAQQKNIEAAVSEANAQREQQTVLKNAENVFKLDMANMAAEQQTELANSKFLQTVTLTEANQEQQAAVVNATNIARADLAEADFYQKAQIDNAKNFLATDMANLNNRQQSNVVKAQYEQQRLLSNQAAQNAMGQFNATNDRQAQQFMAQIETQIRQYNAGYINATNQFNVQSQNAAEARDAQRITDVNKANAAIMNQVEQFNEQLNYNRQQWNAANEQAVINSNIDWRRRANTADTAAQNAVNQQNAQNAFGLTQAAQSFLWQELRDQADYDFRWATDTANRKVQAMMSAATAEGDAAKNWGTNFRNASSTINSLFGS